MSRDDHNSQQSSKSPAINWTENQLQVIDAPVQNILVNAGAGAGKTATMIERIYRQISDQEQPSSLRRMLIVTFTRAAAAQMKDRLSTRLQNEIDQLADSDIEYDIQRHLELEQAYLPQANIQTLHSFCLQVLQDYGHLIGLAPDFELMDEGEEALFRSDVLEEFLDAKFQDENNATVLRGILKNFHPTACYDQLTDEVLRLFSFLSSLPSVDEYCQKAMFIYEQCADDSVPIDDIEPIVLFKIKVSEILDDIVERTSNLLSLFEDINLDKKSLQSYHTGLLEKHEKFSNLRERFKTDGSIPDKSYFSNLPRKFTILKNREDELQQAYDEATEFKTLYDDYKKVFENISDEISLQSIRQKTAEQKPVVEVLLKDLAVGFVDELEKRCVALGRLTFNQLERMTLRLFERHPEVRDQYRRDFDHVFVDEFQDINPLQSRLLQKVSRPLDEDSKGNLFAVGDVKQSIYGFRQADPGQFLKLLQSYDSMHSTSPSPKGLRLDLVENFRSVPAILNNLNEVFQNLFTPEIGGIEFDETHAFVAGKKESDKSQEPQVELLFLDDSQNDSSTNNASDEESSDDDLDLDKVEREAFHLARRIYRDVIVDKKTTLGESAIIIRKAKGRTQALAKALRHYEIPFVTTEAVGFFSEQEITDCLNLLRTINNPIHEIDLVGALRGPAFNWSEDELLELRQIDHEGYLIDNIKLLAKTNSKTAHKADDFLTRMEAWRDLAQRENMGDFLNELYRETKLIEIHEALVNGDQRGQNLRYLRDQAVVYDQFSRKGLHDFLRYLDHLLEQEKSPGEPPNVTENKDALTILTIHKSKGLEFETVYFPFLNERFNQSDLINKVLTDPERGLAINIHPDLSYGEKFPFPTHLQFQEFAKDKLLSEELRLLYVAMTRAEKRLIVSYLVEKPDKLSEKFEELIQYKDTDKLEQLRGTKTLSQLLELGLAEFSRVRNLSPDQPVINYPDKRLQFALEQIEPVPQRTSDGEALTPKDKEKMELDFWKAMIPRIKETQELVSGKPYRSKISATEAKRLYESVHHEQNPNANFSNDTKQNLDWWPQALKDANEEIAENSESRLSILDAGKSKKKALSGSERGTAYHRFLSLVDLFRLNQGQTIEQEINRLKLSDVLSPAEAESLDRDAIELFFQDTEPGRAMITHHEYVYRELPFTCLFQHDEIYGENSNSNSYLLQGIVDVLFLPPEEASAPSPFILDFKTDHWRGTHAHFEELVRKYQSQLRLYQIGLEKSYRRKIPDCYLYFFDADQSYKLETDDPGVWKKYLKVGYETFES